jgi:hypothetical protein
LHHGAVIHRATAYPPPDPATLLPPDPHTGPCVSVAIDAAALGDVLRSLDTMIARARHDWDRETLQELRQGVARQLAALSGT